MARFGCLALVLGCCGALPQVSLATDIVKIGVLAKRGPERCLERWESTADYLGEQIPEYSFKIVPLSFTEIFGVVEKGEVDFLLTNPSIYVELSSRFRVARIATLQNRGDHGFPHAIFGGTVCFRKDQNPSPVWADLEKSRVGAVASTSFGGWLTALREMKAVGLNSEKIANGTDFYGTHDAVAYAVRDGKSDAGVVRSDTLERMAMEGKINLADFSTIPCPGDSYEHHDQFTLLHSTRLYPEWPMAKAYHTSDKLAQKVAIHLMGMPADCEAARAAHLSGWLTPLVYHPVEECLQELRVRPFEDYGKISLGGAIRLYWRWLAIIIVFFGGLVGMGVASRRIRGTNRKLMRTQTKLKKASGDLEVLVRERTDELRESEARFNAIFASTTDAMLIRDLETGAILDVNRRTCELYGRSREELMHSSVGDISANVPPYTQKEANAWLLKVASGEPQHFEWHAKDKNGRLFWVEQVMRRTVIGSSERIVVSMHDITKRRRAEEERVRLMSAVEQAAETIVITDDKGIIEYVNPSFEKITGYSSEEAIGKNPRVLQGGEHDAAFYEVMWETLLRGEAWSGQFTNKKKDGSLYVEDATISPVRDASGKTINYVAVKHDVTERIKLENQFQQAQKMQSLGQLVGGVAHDFNNLLQVINGYAEIACSQLEPTHVAAESIEEITKAGGHASELVKQLLVFSRRQVIDPVRVDLSEEVGKSLKMLRRMIGENIEINFIARDNVDMVFIDKGQFHQVLMNLCVNARDAMPDGGTLIIQTKTITIDSENLNAQMWARHGPHVLLSVSDTGCGMDQEICKQVFDPFFTTKEKGKGTGLGLSTIYGIVKQNNGEIEVHSELGKGTVFEIYLPVIQSPSVDAPSQISERVIPSVGGTEMILVVEDDETIRNLSANTLRSAGYTVLTAKDGENAHQVFEEHADEIDCVMMDVVMPRMGGKEAMGKILKKRPALHYLFVSGYSPNVGHTNFIKEKGFHLLSKPYQADALLRKIRDVLDEN
jgi:two-component system, cell cycle sensor histidine kinase and response regulator CckA